jgi:TonB-dependent starch-binding outer membrane protein SusC
LPGLSFSANLGYSRNTSSEHSENPTSAQNPLYPDPSAEFTTNNFETINIEPQIDYNCTIGRGVLSSLVGGTYKNNNNNSNYIQGSGYSNDNFLGSVNGAARVFITDQTNLYRYAAGFARLKYVYDRKYILSLTGRRDGSSSFGPGRQFGNFGSVGAGWIFSEEKAFKIALPVISYAKISANYGTSGSDGIAAYQYQAFWQAVGYVPSFQGVQPNVPVNLYNPDYSWATKKSLNAALDLGFFHDRLLVNATYYRNREGNQLVGYPLPAHVGFPTVLENLPATIQNSGWEFSVTSNNIKTKDFTWTTTFNISFNRNKLISFPNLDASSYASQYILGQPISEVMGYIFKGVNPATGLFQYATRSGHDTSQPMYGTASEGGDYVPVANREVKYMGGFGNTLSYRHFSLYVFFQFSSQTAPNYLAAIYGSYSPGSGANNLPVQALDYWKQPGDHTTLQKLSAVSYGSAAASAAGNFNGSSGSFSDDTYFRLKTAALSYSLPDGWLKRAKIHDCRIFVNAQNLLTLTDYKVTDPEQFNNLTAVPLQRTVVFGLNFNF